MQTNHDIGDPHGGHERPWDRHQIHLLNLLKLLALPEVERAAYMAGLPEPLEILWGNVEIAFEYAFLELPDVSRETGQPGALEAQCRMLLIQRELWDIWDEMKYLLRETRCAALGSPFLPSDERWPAIQRAARAALLELGLSGPPPPARDWMHLLPVVIPDDYCPPEESPEDRLRADRILARMLAAHTS